jgi:predicted transcriptional regulator
MKSTYNVFSAIADHNRRRILTMLANQPMHVNAIAQNFKVSRPAISKHLRILEHSKLVTYKKEGRENYYSFNPKPLNEVFSWLKYFDRFWDEKLNSLKLFVESKHGSYSKKSKH